MNSRNSPVVQWLEGPEGEAWSREHHSHAHAGESYLPTHIASVRPAPGEDPDWDRPPSSRLRYGVRDPQYDPSGRPPLSRARERARSRARRSR